MCFDTQLNVWTFLACSMEDFESKPALWGGWHHRRPRAEHVEPVKVSATPEPGALFSEVLSA
jgi:hypothetical protein